MKKLDSIAVAVRLSARDNFWYGRDKRKESDGMEGMTAPVITAVYNWANGMTMVFDQFGNQMPEYQGRTEKVMPKIREAGFTGDVPVSVWPRGGIASSGREG
jgi:hypothetical protein